MQVSVGSARQRAHCAGDRRTRAPPRSLTQVATWRRRTRQRKLRRRIPRRKRETSRECVSRYREWAVVPNPPERRSKLSPRSQREVGLKDVSFFLWMGET